MNAILQPGCLRPEDVVALGEWLKAHRMRVDPVQLIAATQLLSSDRAPPPVSQLAPWLAPIFCTNATEQEAFTRHYSDWLEHRGWLPCPVTPAPAPDTGATTHATGGGRMPSWAAWLLLLLAALCATLLWHGRPERTVVVVRGNDKALADAEVLTDNPAVAIGKDSSGNTVLEYRHSQLPLKVSATHTTFLDGDSLYQATARLTSALPRLQLTLRHVPRTPTLKPHSVVAEHIDVLPPPPPVRRARSAEPGPLVIDYGALLTMLTLALAPLLWWLYTAGRRRGFLERMPADGSDTSKRLAIGATPALTANHAIYAT